MVAGNTGESTVAERADGSLLINIRNHPRLSGRRTTAVSKDGGDSWSEPALDEALVDPGCQGSLLRWTAKPEFAKDRLLFANPASRTRERMTVRLSYDDGKTWPAGKGAARGPLRLLVPGGPA